MSFIAFIMSPFFLFVGYLIWKDIQNNSVLYKRIQRHFRSKRLQKYKDQRLSDYHSNYWLWQQGDELVVDKGGYTGIVEIKTYTSTYVIGKDPDSQNDVTVYGKQIVENDTFEKRKRLREAKKFQQNVLPEIRKQNLEDMNMLEGNINNTLQLKN